MADHGWTVRPRSAGFAGAYCPDCSEMLTLYTRSLECTECGHRVESDEVADREGWRYFPDARTLAPFCADCAEELFGV
jgi:hypothetical protein